MDSNINLDHKILNERPISQQPAIDLLVSLGYSEVFDLLVFLVLLLH